MNEYATLSSLRTYMDMASMNTADDDTLREFLIDASRDIDRFTRRFFYPYRRGGTNVLRFDMPDDRTVLRFDEDILEVHGLSDMNGASEIDDSVYWLKTGERWNGVTPYDRIEIDRSSGSSFNFSETLQRAVQADVVEGFHSEYGRSSWIDSGGSLTDALASNITLASTTASEARNSLGISPRFEEGQIWKLGSGASEEYVYVKDTLNTDSSTSTIVLLRGINGTSAAAHAASTQIYIWNPERTIAWAARRLAAFKYHQSLEPYTNRTVVLSLGVIESKEVWPMDVVERLKRYIKREIFSI